MMEEETKPASDEKEVETESAEEAVDETAFYELGYSMLPTVGDEALPKAVGEIKAVLEERGAKVVMEEFPALITLAYTMTKMLGGKKERFGTAYFGWVKFQLPIEHAISLKEALDQNENLLRFLIIKTVREDTRAPKRLMTPKLEEVTPKESRVIRKPEAPDTEKEKKGTMTDAELDKTIEELVVE